MIRRLKRNTLLLWTLGFLACFAAVVAPALAVPDSGPSITAVGYTVNGIPTCDLSAKSEKKSFLFKGSGWRPSSEVQIFVIGPDGNQYTNLHDGGVVSTDSHGNFKWTRVWECYPVDKPGQTGSDDEGYYSFGARQTTGSPGRPRQGTFRIVP